MSKIFPPIEKLQEAQKMIGEVISDWKFLKFKAQQLRERRARDDEK